jgi:hypothetical protein
MFWFVRDDGYKIMTQFHVSYDKSVESIQDMPTEANQLLFPLPPLPY